MDSISNDAEVIRSQITAREVIAYEAPPHANEVCKKMSKRAILGIIGALRACDRMVELSSSRFV